MYRLLVETEKGIGIDTHTSGAMLVYWDDDGSLQFHTYGINAAEALGMMKLVEDDILSDNIVETDVSG